MENYAEQVKKPGYLYIVRRTVPPWRWRENLDELIELCPKYGVDEVCVKIDTGTFTHNYPGLDWLKRYQEILFRIKEELNAVGVNYSLNPNVTQGHGDRGRNIDRQHPDWPPCTGADGTAAHDCMCNIGKGWREYIREQWTLYAETKPVSIWMEDDLRTFGHGPVRTGCFCPEHLRRFNERTGNHFTREELVKRLFAPGRPDPIRVQWLNFLNDMTLEVMEMCEKTIHAVSPDTVFGLMSSGPGAHAGEGRDWTRMYQIMSDGGKYPVLSRPPLGNYQEYYLQGLAYPAISTSLTRQVFGSQCLEEGEIENYPYTGYSKSNTFQALQISAAIGAGEDAVTLNMYDHCGTPMRETEDILQSLAANKPYLTALKSPEFRTDSGIHVYFSTESGKYKEFDRYSPGESFADPVTASLDMLYQLGFAAVAHDSPGAVHFLAGQGIRSASDNEIRTMLSQGAFVDSVAAKALCDRGFGELIGAEVEEMFTLNTTHPLSGEHWHNPAFGGHSPHAFSLAIHNQVPRFAVLRPLKGAQEITEFVDPDFKRLCPGTQAFENRLGGRVVVFPLEFTGLCSGFKTPDRKKFMRILLEWLSRGPLPLFVEGARNLLPMRFDNPDCTKVGIYNLSHDELKQISATLSFAAPADRVEVLRYGSAQWEIFPDWKQENGVLTLMLESIAFNTPLYFKIYRKG